VLHRLLETHEAAFLLEYLPAIALVDLQAWEDFFLGLGAGESYLPRLLRRAPQFFVQASIHGCGSVLLHLKGATGLDIGELLECVVIEVPGVGLLDVEGELEPRLEELRLAGLDRWGLTQVVVREPLELLRQYPE
jgi:hypothetical protein